MKLLSRTPLPSSENFWKKEKLKFSLIPCTVPTLPHAITCDFWFFGALKWELRNRHFELDVELVTALNHLFQYLPPEGIPQNTDCKMPGQKLTCVANDGGYLEKDIVDRDGDDDE